MSFWDYCEGKKGECLEPDTKFFDGYWHPEIMILTGPYQIGWVN